MDWTSSWRYLEIGTLLLDNHADIDKTEINTNNLLHVAIIYVHLKVALVLVSSNANINKATNDIVLLLCVLPVYQSRWKLGSSVIIIRCMMKWMRLIIMFITLYIVSVLMITWIFSHNLKPICYVKIMKVIVVKTDEIKQYIINHHWYCRPKLIVIWPHIHFWITITSTVWHL